MTQQTVETSVLANAAKSLDTPVLNDNIVVMRPNFKF